MVFVNALGTSGVHLCVCFWLGWNPCNVRIFVMRSWLALVTENQGFQGSLSAPYQGGLGKTLGSPLGRPLGTLYRASLLPLVGA